MPIIACSLTFDQSTMERMMQHDAIVQDYRALFCLLDWSVIPDNQPAPSEPGRRPYPLSAYLKALLVKVREGFSSCTHLRAFLLKHPLLVIEPGFRLHVDITQP